ncbi:MAG: hydrogenase 3 maturation endopeptidase HyCI [Kiritimatiellaeota bacterium]|nr:hydrogenase 3 maturation endopeptidase HyCI [Kiritimatiellota bacterium]
MTDLTDGLRQKLQGKVCVLGIGNRLKGDDAAGPELIDRITGRSRFHCLDAGVAPENYLEKIVRIGPDTILLVDAIDFGGAAGSCRLFAADQITGGGLSSHALSLRMTCDYLQQRIKVHIFILGIQPAQVNMNGPLSAAVSAAVEKLAAELSTLA